MMYKPEPRYSHLSFGSSKQPLPVHSPIVMESLSSFKYVLFSFASKTAVWCPSLPDKASLTFTDGFKH